MAELEINIEKKNCTFSFCKILTPLEFICHSCAIKAPLQKCTGLVIRPVNQFRFFGSGNLTEKWVERKFKKAILYFPPKFCPFLMIFQRRASQNLLNWRSTHRITQWRFTKPKLVNRTHHYILDRNQWRVYS